VIEDHFENEDTWLWLVPYGDMMSILMVFFMILYAFAFCANNIDYERFVTHLQKDILKKTEKKTNTIARVMVKEAEVEEAYKMSKVLNEKGLSKIAQVDINAQKMRILLTAPVLFDVGTADLTDYSKLLLKQIAVLLTKLPNQVLIEGHTDNVPIKTRKYGSNWELSVDRAISVVNYFIKEEKIPAERLGIAGYGEYQPLFANDTAEHKGRNRRIEIVILRKTS
jgi:chemotaxis protein MotB